MPNRHTTLTSLFTDIAGAIRSKTGDSAEIKADDFDTAIQNIPTGGEPTPTSDDYLYFECVELTDGYSYSSFQTIFNSFDNNNIEKPRVQYSTDKINWIDTENYKTFELNLNQRLYFRNLSNYLSVSSSIYFQFSASSIRGKLKVGGRLGSMLNDVNTNTKSASYAYSRLFSGNINLVYSDELILVTTINNGSFFRMFDSCSNLLTTPTLPYYEIIPSGAYEAMFYGCKKIVTAPNISCKFLGPTALGNMFCDCTSLINAPTIEVECITDSTALSYMFKNCKSLVIPPALPNIFNSYNYSCYQYMFQNCTSLTHVPALPSTKLLSNCYNSMFDGCTSLKVYAEPGEGHNKAWNIPGNGPIQGNTVYQTNMFRNVQTDSVPAKFPGTAGTQFTYYTEFDPVQ